MNLKINRIKMTRKKQELFKYLIWNLYVHKISNPNGKLISLSWATNEILLDANSSVMYCNVCILYLIRKSNLYLQWNKH